METRAHEAFFLEGPVSFRFGKGHSVPVERYELGYERQGSGPREWRVELQVDRAYLLPIAEAGVLPIEPLQIIRFDIIRPVRLRLAPRSDLAQALDLVQDHRPVVTLPEEKVDQVVAGPLTDLGNYHLVEMSQS